MKFAIVSKLLRIRSLIFLSLILPAITQAESLVGALPGEINVTNTGAAIYTVPLSLPAGIAGFTPELSLQYDSSRGKGLLGIGFALNGLSAITRVPANLEQDDRIDGIDFDTFDRFALDGQRLVCVSGNYGAASSEYRTEIDSFVRITAHGTAGSATSGPDYFIIETKDGLKKTYGRSDANALVYNLEDSPHTNAKITWLLEKIEDRNGNSIRYVYHQNTATQQKYLSRITWGNAAHLLKATFEYEDRPDPIASFLQASISQLPNALKPSVSTRVQQKFILIASTMMSAHSGMYHAFAP